MIQLFTKYDVLKAQSGELDTEEQALLNSAVQESEALKQFAHDASQLKADMKKLRMSPSARPLQNILAFAGQKK